MGCETSLAMPWVKSLVERFGKYMRHPNEYLEALSNILLHADQIHNCPVKPDVGVRLAVLDSCKKTLRAMQSIEGLPPLYKYHFWVHLARRIGKYGPPVKMS
eukprot:2224882-Pyramimonas_sp.AAC.1